MLIAVGLLAIAVGDQPVVRVHDQNVLGHFAVFSYTKTVVEEFLGIPYAQPPVNELRFRKPVPLKLERTLNASSYSPGCMAEFGMFTTETSNFSEDCLYLNIWRPKKTKPNDSKAVVVVFHGGGYSAGDGSERDWRGKTLCALEDVIVVNFNYRLGIFGFLDLGVEDAPGHLGHWDQLMVLEWIRDNIRNFGGDPDRVLVVGVSAGSFSISAHLMSPHSKRLFYAAVLDAGVVALNDTVEQHVERSSSIADSVSCAHSTVEELLQCLKRIDAPRLVELQQRFAVSQTYTFRPTRSNEFIGRHRGSLEDLLESSIENFNHVPIMIGDSAKEGTFLMTEHVHDPIPNLKDPQATLELMTNITRWHKLGEFSAESLVSVYGLSENLETAVYTNATADFTGDLVFLCLVNRFASEYSEYAMVYQYFWKRLTEAPTAGANPWAFGAYHGIPFYHMIGSFFESFDDLPPEDVSYSIAAMRMLADFAKTAKQPVFRGVSLPAFDSTDEKVFIFDHMPHTVTGHPRQHICDALLKKNTKSTRSSIDEL